MKAIKYQDLGNKLIRTFPMLTPEYNRMLKLYGREKPGPHVVYSALNAYIVKCIEDKNVTSLRKIFSFLEQLSTQKSKKVQEVVQMTVLGCLGKNREHLKYLSQYMGLATKKLSDEIEAFWWTPKNRPPKLNSEIKSN